MNTDRQGLAKAIALTIAITALACLALTLYLRH
jgi:hypothetical protein